MSHIKPYSSGIMRTVTRADTFQDGVVAFTDVRCCDYVFCLLTEVQKFIMGHLSHCGFRAVQIYLPCSKSH